MASDIYIFSSQVSSRHHKTSYQTPGAQQDELRTRSTPGHARSSVNHSYMILSHCWGNAKFFKLTPAWHGRLSNGVPNSLLANTFQDAMYVAEQSGASYIWIDSLCIIQDSLEDWHQESVTMCDFYKGSLCTIAAAASSSSEEGGILRTRPAVYQPVPRHDYVHQ